MHANTRRCVGGCVGGVRKGRRESEMTEDRRKKQRKGDERERKEEVTLNCSALILEEIVLKMV